MRRKRYEKLLQVKISQAANRKLSEASRQTGLDRATLRRLSLRLGLPKLLHKLPQVEASNE